MNISSRAVATTEKKYKNTFWKRFFSIKLAKTLFPKLNEKVQHETIKDFKLMSYDFMCDHEYEHLGSEFSVYYLREDLNSELEEI